MPSKIKNIEDIRGHLSPRKIAKRASEQQAMFDFKELTAQPPEWLDDLAVSEWQRIVPLLKADVPISELDVAMLASYCQTYSDIQKSAKHIQDEGPVVEAVSGSIKVNPYMNVKRNATQDLMKLADALGLSVYGRLKMQIKGDVKTPDDPFAKLVKNE
ncbi:phage terminase small subunit P27 family [Schleiferilactobacillus harbinensis]|uniref:phage terminase small subunit P27 family n=1 Tax=Schleiferilactobacillus harbinensis TaxID=304207 RepID=UPI00123BC194|nr:phage terminase small subunit P27 family [Schleiferilactobacillus harbinensis]QEU48013.1 phage terminase small subunit P27 family [Schleiferilactobacillus harbinensis]